MELRTEQTHREWVMWALCPLQRTKMNCWVSGGLLVNTYFYCLLKTEAFKLINPLFSNPLKNKCVHNTVDMYSCFAPVKLYSSDRRL